MEFVKLLLSDDAERAHFAADPDDTLSQHGLAELSPADVHDAVVPRAGHAHRRLGAGLRRGGRAPRTRRTLEPRARPEPHDWWAAERTRSGGRARRPAPPPAAPAVDDVLFDAPDLHFGH